MTEVTKIKKSFLIPSYLDAAIKKQMEKEPYKDYTTIVIERLDRSFRAEGYFNPEGAE